MSCVYFRVQKANKRCQPLKVYRGNNFFALLVRSRCFNMILIFKSFRFILRDRQKTLKHMISDGWRHAQRTKSKWVKNTHSIPEVCPGHHYLGRPALERPISVVFLFYDPVRAQHKWGWINESLAVTLTFARPGSVSAVVLAVVTWVTAAIFREPFTRAIIEVERKINSLDAKLLSINDWLSVYYNRTVST